MRSTLGLLGLAVASALLLGCESTPKSRGPAIVPVGGAHTITVERVYVAIDPNLTTPCEVKRGPLREVIAVARQRRACLEELNARMARIAAIQGTKVDADPKD